MGDLPRILKGLWFLQLLQVPVTGLSLAGAVIHLVLWRGASPYVLVFIPLLAAAYRMIMIWKNKRSVEFFVAGSVLAMAFLAFAGGMVNKDAFNKDPRYDTGRLAQVARITSGHKLYTLHLGEKITWNIRRTSTMVGPNSTVESFPAMMLTRQEQLERFRQWTAEGGISYKEIYRLIYGAKEEGYILFELSNEAPRAAPGHQHLAQRNIAPCLCSRHRVGRSNRVIPRDGICHPSGMSPIRRVLQSACFLKNVGVSYMSSSAP